MPSLCDLPNEVIALIATSPDEYHQPFGSGDRQHRFAGEDYPVAFVDYVLDQVDLAALAISCRRLHQAVNRCLYNFNKECRDSDAIAWAAAHASTETLDLAVAYGLDVINAKIFAEDIPDDASLNSGHCHPIQVALFNEHIQTVAWFVDHGYDINRPARALCRCEDINLKVTTLLHCAICLENDPMARMLVSRGAHLWYTMEWQSSFHGDGGDSEDEMAEFKTKSRTSALAQAANNGLDDLIPFLVEQPGLDINSVDGRGFSVLVCACLSKSESTVDLVLKLGGDVNGASHVWKQSPLKWSIAMEFNLNITLKLLDSGASIFAADFPGKRWRPTPLHELVALSWCTSSSRDRTCDLVIRKLVERGIDINAVDHSRHRTPLQIASAKDSINTIETLIAEGADVNMSSKHSPSPLALTYHIKDQQARRRIAQCLLRHGARVDIRCASQPQTCLEKLAALPEDGEHNEDLNDVLEACSNINVSQQHLDEVLEKSLIAGSFHATHTLLRHGAQPPQSRDILYHFVRDGITDCGQLVAEYPKRTYNDEHSSCFWDVAARTELALTLGLEPRDAELLLVVAIKYEIKSATNILLNVWLQQDTQGIGLTSYGLLFSAAQAGTMSVMRRLWNHIKKKESSEHLIPIRSLSMILARVALITQNAEIALFLLADQDIHSSCDCLDFTTAALALTSAFLQRLYEISENDAQMLSEWRHDKKLDLALRRDVDEGSLISKVEFEPPDAMPMTALEIAVRHGHIAVIRSILTQLGRGLAVPRQLYIPCALHNAEQVRGLLISWGINA